MAISAAESCSAPAAAVAAASMFAALMRIGCALLQHGWRYVSASLQLCHFRNCNILAYLQLWR